MTPTNAAGMGIGRYPRPDVPRFSVSERDYRWSRVRALMDRNNIDVILAFNNSGNWDQGSANGRYLSSIGGNCAAVSVVFPRDGEVTAITGPVPTPDYWLQFQDWVSDIRTAFFNATPVVIERIRELGLERARIGIAGLQGVAREPDGLVSQGAFRALAEGLPHAELMDATGMMYEARFIKSPEEIGMLEKSVSLVERALDVLDREARPGVPETVVYARMMASLLEGGSEPTSLLLWTAGHPLPPVVGTLASQRRLEPEDIILVEVDGKWCGYLGHAAATCWVGEVDATAQHMAELQFEAVQRCCEAMRPGTRMDSFVKICGDVVAGTSFDCKPVMHSRGLGLDAPVLVYQARDDRTAQWTIAENSVFAIKPVVSTSDGSQKVMWGDTVVATKTGGRRLGRRPAPAGRRQSAESLR